MGMNRAQNLLDERKAQQRVKGARLVQDYCKAAERKDAGDEERNLFVRVQKWFRDVYKCDWREIIRQDERVRSL